MSRPRRKREKKSAAWARGGECWMLARWREKMAGRVGMRSYDETPTSHQPGGVSRGTDRPAELGATAQTPSASAAALRFRRRGRVTPMVAFPAKWYTSPAPPDVGVVPRAPLLPAGSLCQEVELQPHAPLVASSSCCCCAAVQKGQSHSSASPGCSASPMQSAWNHSAQRSQHTRKATRQPTPRRPLPSFMCGSPHKHPNRSCS